MAALKEEIMRMPMIEELRDYRYRLAQMRDYFVKKLCELVMYLGAREGGWRLLNSTAPNTIHVCKFPFYTDVSSNQRKRGNPSPKKVAKMEMARFCKPGFIKASGEATPLPMEMARAYLFSFRHLRLAKYCEMNARASQESSCTPENPTVFVSVDGVHTMYNHVVDCIELYGSLRYCVVEDEDLEHAFLQSAWNPSVEVPALLRLLENPASELPRVFVRDTLDKLSRDADFERLLQTELEQPSGNSGEGPKRRLLLEQRD